MTVKKVSKATLEASLVGQFFHSIGDDGEVEWQGYVLGNPEPGWYLIQLFEWLMGEPNIRRLVKLSDMESWLFYEDADAMKFSYEYGAAREGGRYRKHFEETEPMTIEKIRGIMRPIAFMNGWKDAPHCWKTFLGRPIRVERTPGLWISFSIVGLVWFFNDFLESA